MTTKTRDQITSYTQSIIERSGLTIDSIYVTTGNNESGESLDVINVIIKRDGNRTNTIQSLINEAADLMSEDLGVDIEFSVFEQEPDSANYNANLIMLEFFNLPFKIAPDQNRKGPTL